MESVSSAATRTRSHVNFGFVYLTFWAKKTAIQFTPCVKKQYILILETNEAIFNVTLLKERFKKKDIKALSAKQTATSLVFQHLHSPALKID